MNASTNVPAGFVKMGNRLVPAQTNFGTPKQKTRKFLLVLQYYAGDQAAAEQLGALIADLERTRNHDADVLIWGRFDAPQFSPTVIAKLEAKFGKVMIERCRRRDGINYPFAANNMFHDLAGILCCMPWLAEYYAFLPLESDCTPCRPGWIGELIAGFLEATKRNKFVIGFIENDPRPHVNGVAVYATDVRKRAGSALLGCGPNVCYDIAAAPVILPLAEDSALFEFKYRQPTITPDELFAVRKAGIAPALYHGVKDGSARAAVRARHITFTSKPNAVPLPPIFRADGSPSAIGIMLNHTPDAVFPSGMGETITDTKAIGITAAVMGGDRPKESLGVAAAIRAEESTALKVAAISDALETQLPELSEEANKDMASELMKSPLIQAPQTPPKRPNVYTYSHKHDGVTKPEMNAILAAWTKGWTSRGWNPVVLTLRDAAKHAKFEEFQTAVEKLPCVGDKKRMAHRFYRWLALDVVGGGLLTDWDVLPGDFNPSLFEPINGWSTSTWFLRQSDGDKMVGAYLSKDAGIRDWIDLVMKYDAQPDDIVATKPHVSDDTIARRSLYGQNNAPADLIHFNGERVKNERKSVAMERFLAGK